MSRTELLTERLAQLEGMVAETRDQIMRRDDEISGAVSDLLAALMAILPPEAAGAIRRQQLIRSVIPPGATVLVASKGDADLLRLDGRRAWHFPQAENGEYAGYYPESAGAAIVHLEGLRAKGADYLVFPAASLWWLDHYAEFQRHLDRRFRLAAHQDETCAIYDLRPTISAVTTTPQIAFEQVLAEFEQRFDHAPAVLDWNTGLDLATTFSERPVFSPPTSDQILPYLDETVDIVAAAPGDVAEARRVARAAVVTVDSTAPGATGPASLVTDWKEEVPVRALPSTSIVIPSYNSIGFTEMCLTALDETLPHEFNGEIIVIDDASSDQTPDIMRRRSRQDARIRYVRNRTNLGFVDSCNRAANLATGEYLVFLNMDTVPFAGWLEALLRTFEDYPDAGAVGGRLVYPDGRLQEAGGVIFRDGSGANFGKGSLDPDEPLFSYVREVDYCSGALLATKRALFEDLGGFDTRYRPAYYEDADFCFSVRAAGHRVYYQPECVTSHFEGVAHGTDVTSGGKRHQVENRVKFVDKWRHVLDQQPSPPGRYDLATWFALAVRDNAEEIGER